MRLLTRTGLVLVATLIAGGLAAASADARLVYVKKADTAAPVVYMADDDGSSPHRLGVGRAPTVSPDGKWIAWISVADKQGEDLIVQSATGVARRYVMHSVSIDSVRFSPDSARVAAVLGGRRVRVYDIAGDSILDVFRGAIRGYAFSPDATQLVAGKATGRAIDAASDLYVAPITGGAARRLTTTGDAVNPVWGQTEVVYDRQRRRHGDLPAYNLWAVDAAGVQPPRRLTKLKIPPTISGLVPLELSADGGRLLTIFTGRNAGVGFTLTMATGRTHALSRNLSAGVVGFDISADGTTLLAHTNGLDPARSHNVVTIPYAGGKRTTIVKHASFPDWSR
jgi:Tol biopolymer transport system component